MIYVLSAKAKEGISMNLEAAEGIIGAILFMLNTLVWGFVLWLMVA